MKIFQPFYDLIFPPICPLCREKTRSLLCSNCTELLMPPDPHFRCRHCFSEEIDQELRLCRQCLKEPLLQAPRAYLFESHLEIHRSLRSLFLKEIETGLLQTAASLFVLQWGRLGWSFPDWITMVPRRGEEKSLQFIAEEVARLLGRPLKKELVLHWEKPFQWRIKRKKQELLDEKCLLLLDFGGSIEELRAALGELWLANPRQVYLLSLFLNDSREETPKYGIL